MAKALYSADPLTGLIVAAALISPEKKLSAIEPDFVVHRMGEKSFAKGANRDTIRACSELGLSLEEFVSIGLSAMQGIHEEWVSRQGHSDELSWIRTEEFIWIGNLPASS
jgi:predicted hydrolase (HD superfamily)